MYYSQGMAAVRVLYFTDVLCVWAYLNQVRIDELRASMGEHVQIEPRFCSVFGDVPGKLEKNWGFRGGALAYGAHVQKVASEHTHVSVHEGIWGRVAPHSSLPAHLFLCAVRQLEADHQLEVDQYYKVCWALREAFFRDARDVSQRSVLFEVAEEQSLARNPIERLLNSGCAHALLSEDDGLARKYDVVLSPSMILNEGRQRLNGNVGFRVIEANVRELMHKPQLDDASWC